MNREEHFFLGIIAFIPYIYILYILIKVIV
jgi:hypothetical protein